MPSMYEIYENHAIEYDELLAHEDHEGNLRKAVRSLIDFTGKDGYEFGVGTGRLTSTYIELVHSVRCFDRSTHMMDKAKENLAEYSGKVTFSTLDNTRIAEAGSPRDFFIEGWSFGHTIMDRIEDVPQTSGTLVGGSETLVKQNGMIMFIETLGTNVRDPGLPDDHPLTQFYNLLETEYAMTRTVVRTDYRFPSNQEAVRIMGYFFGEAMGRAVQDSGDTVIPEFTGIWSKKGL